MDANEEETPPGNRFRFSMRSLLWVTALLSAGMGTFGPAFGAVLSAAVVATHLTRRARIGLMRLAIALGVLWILVVFLLPAIPSARSAALRNQSMNNLKALTLAMLNFESANGHMPPPYSVDGEGEPLHSWRTLMLPYFGIGTAYKKLRLDEPWDSPSNRKVFDAIGDGVFRSPREAASIAPKGETHYLAVVDDETLWRPAQIVQIRDVKDGTSQTVALIEVAGRGVCWAEPRDLTLEEAIDVLVGDIEEEYVDPGFFVSRRMRGDGLPDRSLAFVDGHVQTLAGPIADRVDARALLTRAGGELVNPLKGAPVTRSVETNVIAYTVHWGRVFGLTLFVALAVAPLLVKRCERDALHQ